MEYILSVLILATEELALINICEAFFEKRHKAKVVKITFVPYIIGLTLLTQFLTKDMTLLKYVTMCFINLCWICCIYRGNILQKAFTIITFFVLIYSSENVTVIFLIGILNISLERILQVPIYFVISAIISKSILFTVTYLFRRMYISKKQLDYITYKEWIQMLIFPVISVITLIALLDLSIRSGYVSIWILFDTVGILIANISILLITGKLSVEKKTKLDNTILRQQIKQEMENVQETLNAYSGQRRLTHDFNNHMNALYEMAIVANNTQISEYISGLKKQIGKTERIIKSNNIVVDAILNQKYIVAKNSNITMSFIIGDLSKLLLSDEDIVTILANALDNAIEACILNKKEKTIKVKITHENYETIISIQNTVDEDVEIQNNTVKTTKQHSLEHGYGIKNIKTVLQKYEHIFILRSEKNWFKLTIVLPQ